MTITLIGSLLLAAVFFTAGAAKLRDLPGSRDAIEGFGVPASLATPLGVAVPLAELTVAGALLVGPTRAWGALGALTLLAGFSLAIAWNLGRGRTPDCHCFGQLHSSPADPRTLARNAALIAVAGLVASQADPAWTGIAAAGGFAIAAAGWALSRRAKPAGSDGAPGSLAVGTAAPSFALPALEGYTVSLEGLLGLGKPALLVFSDPDCGPCQAMAPEIAEWQRLHSDELTIAVIESRDGATAGQSDEHGRRTVLLQSDTEVSDAYDAQGTPTAVLVGADGRIASAVAGGTVGIEALMAASIDHFEPRSASAEAGHGWGLPRRLGGPLIRRELLVRGATAGAALSAALAWPMQALGMVRGRGRCGRYEQRCGDKCCPRGSACRSQRCVVVCERIGEPDECVNGYQGCTNFTYDPSNCGECGHRCPSNVSCVRGECAPGDGSCAGCCLGLKVDLNDDPKNCGDCGNLCPDDKPDCYFGRCTDFRSDPAHCGTKNDGYICNKTQVCYAGKCRDKCPKPLRQCGRTCGRPSTQRCCGGKLIDKDDLQFDDKNCSGCGNECRGQFDTCCSGVCQSLAIDGNCGACGVSCPPGYTCQGRKCICLVTLEDGTCQGA